MSRSSSGIVAGLTTAALAVVAFLAYQASADVPADLGKPIAPHSVSPSATGKNALAVPAKSGTGKRVVYALHDRRAWLVGAGGKASRSIPVVPSTVDPLPGEYTVTTRTARGTGSDGMQIEHVVLFAEVDDVAIGFSAAVDGSLSLPDPNRKTGGVRMKPVDADAVWDFAPAGTTVVVVP